MKNLLLTNELFLRGRAGGLPPLPLPSPDQCPGGEVFGHIARVGQGPSDSKQCPGRTGGRSVADERGEFEE